MERIIPRRVLDHESEAIMELLTTHQHLHPHEATQDALARLTRELGCCPAAIARATGWLHLSAEQSIGRLRRTELLQLSKAIQRFWKLSIPAETSGSHPS